MNSAREDIIPTPSHPGSAAEAAPAILKQFGRLLRCARRQQNLTLSQLAEHTGHSARTLQRIEAGDTGIAVRSVAAYLAALNLDGLVTPTVNKAVQARDSRAAPFNESPPRL